MMHRGKGGNSQDADQIFILELLLIRTSNCHFEGCARKLALAISRCFFWKTFPLTTQNVVIAFNINREVPEG